jgi:PAS domain S-box-containing protein
MLLLVIKCMKILFLEEKQSEIKLYESILEDAMIAFEGKSAKTENEFIKHINHFNPDVILSGYSLSKYSVNEALKYLDDQSLLIPFVFITGSISEEMARSYLQKGVDDYVPKSNLLHLPVTLKNVMAKKTAERGMQQADELRKISEDKLRAIFENNPECIFEVGFDGGIIELNPAAIDLMDLQLPLKAKLKIWDFIQRGDLKTFKYFHQSICRGNKKEFTFSFVSRRGKVNTIEACGSPLFDNEKNVSSALIIGRNITEKTRAENKLKTAEANFHALVENIQNGVWSLDKNYCLISFNDYYRKAVKKGVGKEPKPGQCFDELIPVDLLTEFRAKWIPYFERAFNGEQLSFELVSTVPKQKGYYQIFLNPIYSGKAITGISCVSIETSDIKNAQEQLIKSEELFRNLSENCPDAIYIEDEKGNILHVNKEACRFQGMLREQLIGKNILQLAPADKAEVIMHDFNKLFREDISRLRSKTWNRNGFEFPIEIHSRRIVFNDEPALLLLVRDLEDSQQLAN